MNFHGFSGFLTCALLYHKYPLLSNFGFPSEIYAVSGRCSSYTNNICHTIKISEITELCALLILIVVISMIMGHRPKPSVDKLLHLSTPVKVISCCWATFNKQTLIEKSTTPVTIFQRSRPKTFASVTPNWDQKSDRIIPLRQILEMREHLMLGLVFEPAHFFMVW